MLRIDDGWDILMGWIVPVAVGVVVVSFAVGAAWNIIVWAFAL